MVSVFMYLLFSVFTEYLKYLSIRRHRDVKSLTVSTFSSVRALCGLPMPGRLSTVLLSRNFFNSLLTLRFVQLFLRKFVCEPLCCVPLQIQTFHQILVLVAEYHIVLLTNTAVTFAETYFRCHKLIVKVSK